MARDLSFFDLDKARGPSKGPDVGEDLPFGASEEDAGPISVSGLIRRIKGALGEAFPQPVAGVGELSNVKRHTSGHIYFRLKDAGASIDAVMFRSRAARVKFEIEDGLEVVATVRVDVYDVRGQLQLYVERMTPRGAGALELAFRQLREKLEAEGLFETAPKKSIPAFPRAIGVVTSATGAAIRDIRRTLARRWASADVYLTPVLVQGEGAAEQIAEAIGLLDAAAEKYHIDTLIVARGGGSLEDLWAFNEEVVARAIFAARTPIVCGVGHESDVTVADLVADLRAPTPTGAAELATPNAPDVAAHVLQLSQRLGRMVGETCERGRAALKAVRRSVVFRDPTSRLRTQAQRMDELEHRLRGGGREVSARAWRRLEPAANRLAALHPARLSERARARLDRATSDLRWILGVRSKRAGDELGRTTGRLRAAHPRHRFRLAVQQIAAIARQLEAMSYRNVLGRGFSVTREAEGSILRSVKSVRAGRRVETELADGKFASVVNGGEGTGEEAHARRLPRKRKPDEPKSTLFD